MKLEGYAEPYRNDRNKDGGGILLAVRKELGNITVEVRSTTEYLESLWVVINNNKVKLRIGVTMGWRARKMKKRMNRTIGS